MQPFQYISKEPVVSLLVASAFLLPLWPGGAYAGMGVAALLLLWKRRLLPAIPQAFRDREIRWMIFFYLAYLAGMLFTSHGQTGWKELLSKLPFLLFPVLFTAANVHDLKQSICKAFAAGVTCICIFLLFQATVDFVRMGDVRVFFYESFSGAKHPTYLAIYISFSLLVLLSDVKDRWQRRRPLWMAAYVFGIVVLILTSARMAIVAGLFTVCLALIAGYRLGRVPLPRLLLLVFIPALLYFTVLQISSSANRFAEVETYLQTEKKTDEGSIQARIKIWSASGPLVLQHLFTGVGTGDVQSELHDLYGREGFQYALSRNLNAHNQFLQVLLATGLPGLLLFLIVFLAAGRSSFRRRDVFAMCFLLIAALNALTESFLEREAGILWFTFFYCLLFSGEKEELDDKRNGFDEKDLA